MMKKCKTLHVCVCVCVCVGLFSHILMEQYSH